jgi:hypothetical protein
MKTCAERVTNTTEFILVNFYLIKGRPAFVSAHSFYLALRVVSADLQPHSGARCADHDLSYGVAFRMQSGDLLSLIKFAAVIFLIRSLIF